jgi:hypothetical protein
MARGRNTQRRQRHTLVDNLQDEGEAFDDLGVQTQWLGQYLKHLGSIDIYTQSWNGNSTATTSAPLNRTATGYHAAASFER